MHFKFCSHTVNVFLPPGPRGYPIQTAFPRITVAYGEDSETWQGVRGQAEALVEDYEEATRRSKKPSRSLQNMALSLARFTNFLLLIFTFGIAWPWTRVRSQRLYLENLYLDGRVDLEGIAQDA